MNHSNNPSPNEEVFRKLTPQELREAFDGHTPVNAQRTGAISPDDFAAGLASLVASGESMGHPYAPLLRAFYQAWAQAAIGKGRERHAKDKPFLEQTIFETAAAHGIGFVTGQAEKKLREAVGMKQRGEDDKAAHELLGAIVYTAAAWLTLTKD